MVKNTLEGMPLALITEYFCNNDRRGRDVGN
jgi:hypothetical protein